MLQKAQDLIKNHRLAEAATLCEQHLRNNKKDLETWLLLADIYQHAGMVLKAENSYRKLIKLKANHTLAHTRLAMLYHSQGKFAKAEPGYRQSLKLNNNNAPVHFNLGVVLHEQGKLNDAIAHYQQAIALKPDYAKAYANLGYVLRLQKNTEGAIDSYRKALQFAPDMAEIHYNIGMTLLETGQAELAEQHQRQALGLKPDYADAFAGLGAVQLFTGNLEEAANSYQQALRHQPGSTEFLSGYASTLSALGQHEQALKLIKQALAIEPNNLEASITQGFIYLSLGKLDEALDCCNHILTTSPQDTKAIGLAASIYEKKGDAQQAYQYLAPLLDHAPPVGIVLSFASVSKSLGLADKAIEYMEQLLRESKNMTIGNQRKLHFALGKAYDEQRDFDRAFKNFETANKLKQAVFDIKHTRNAVDAQMRVFSSDFSGRLSQASTQSNRPVFIVGMPRSGTSLVEQILASHSQISGAGELSDISDLAASMKQAYKLNYHYPECLEEIKTQSLDDIAQAYLGRLSNINNSTRHVTDKMPGNFMHLGLIQLLFPEARIIHCIRDPLDTCLSCYFQDFSENYPWIYDLEDCSRVYIEYQRLMQHWKNVLSIPILDVQYEELVDNQQTISRQMIEFCDLDWEDECLHFYKNKRFIWTASYDQVRQPMYNKSIKRWKNYESYIAPLIEALQNKNILPSV